MAGTPQRSTFDHLTRDRVHSNDLPAHSVSERFLVVRLDRVHRCDKRRPKGIGETRAGRSCLDTEIDVIADAEWVYAARPLPIRQPDSRHGAHANRAINERHHNLHA